MWCWCRCRAELRPVCNFIEESDEIVWTGAHMRGYISLCVRVRRREYMCACESVYVGVRDARSWAEQEFDENINIQFIQQTMRTEAPRNIDWIVVAESPDTHNTDNINIHQPSLPYPSEILTVVFVLMFWAIPTTDIAASILVLFGCVVELLLQTTATIFCGVRIDVHMQNTYVYLTCYIHTSNIYNNISVSPSRSTSACISS